MTRESTVATLALLVALSPFLGLPYTLLMWIVPSLGVLIALLSFSGRFARRSRPHIPHDEQSV